MKIECISNSASNLPMELMKSELGIGSDRQFSLIVGKQYVVYGFTIFLGHVWFYICDEDYTYYPIWNPSVLFKIVDPRLSTYWEFGFYKLPGGQTPIIAFKEWTENPFFYDKLTDGDASMVGIFKHYRVLLDSEFKTPTESM